jgi:hypothetical protein
LAKSKANAIPHVMVFRGSDGFAPAPERGHYLKQRLLVGDYLVGPELEDWLQQGLPLRHLETLIGESAGEPPRFDGRWRNTKNRNPDRDAESIELDVIPLSGPERFRIELREGDESTGVPPASGLRQTGWIAEDAEPWACRCIGNRRSHEHSAGEGWRDCHV